MHDVGNRGRCRNLRVATTILDHTVVGLIRAVMLEPDKLFRCIEGGQGTEGRAALKELGRIAEAIDALTEKRGRIFEAYAKEQMGAVDGTVTVTRWLGTEGPYSVRLWIISHTAATAFRASSSSRPSGSISASL